MGQMTLLITGAGGFIGRETVAAARRRGHHVRALVRRAGTAPEIWANDPDVSVVVCDLARGEAGLTDAVAGCDAVIHLAAAMSGPEAQQLDDTVTGTRYLIEAVAGLETKPKVVLVSSIAVYGHDAVPEGGVLSEDTPLEPDATLRDVYCQAKYLQEEVAQTFARTHAIDLIVMRPGAVFGPGRWWNAHFGPRVGPVLLRLSADGTVPVVYVKNCAEGLVSACKIPTSGPVNMIEPDAPSRQTYLIRLGQARTGRIVPLNWRLLLPLARFLSARPGLRARLPGLLCPEILQARMIPLRYDTSRFAALMQDVPCIPFEQALEQSLSSEEEGPA
ncbi:NAD(P)-dependent oxidoreductase [Thalassococcus sp. S3]|uniref:NAD-dependent epimerase/dehydratase family protein n=1 Tax=Thalassococcus sp. S3 TaxID=2017482 RepID=UPI0010240EAB|nr:NAD(P)-dependent oxidoreductase [Thalassococcus sp. S3]QBF31975.1 oxidoreductase [Thalassococcus sp. S3]